MCLALEKQNNKPLFLSLKLSHCIYRDKKTIVIQSEKYHRVTGKLLEEIATHCLHWLKKTHREGDICSGPQRMNGGLLGESGEEGEHRLKELHA